MHSLNLLSATALGFFYFMIVFAARTVLAAVASRHIKERSNRAAVIGFLYFVVSTLLYSLSPLVFLGLLLWVLITSFSAFTLTAVVSAACLFVWFFWELSQENKILNAISMGYVPASMHSLDRVAQSAELLEQVKSQVACGSNDPLAFEHLTALTKRTHQLLEWVGEVQAQDVRQVDERAESTRH